MNGFLQRLVLRASGEVPTLKPRTPGLFEPPAQRAPAPMLADDGMDPSADIGFAEDPRPPPPVVGDGHAGAGRASAAALSPAAAIQSAHAGDSNDSARPAERVGQPVAGDAMPQAASALAPAPVARSAARATIRVQTLQPLVDAVPARRDRPAVPPRSAGSAPVPARTELPLAPERPEARTLTPGPVTLAPSMLQAAHAAPALRAAAAVPPPVIEVTIGRVEVRANTQAQAPQPARARPQPTSLDEYLARREGRTRR